MSTGDQVHDHSYPKPHTPAAGTPLPTGPGPGNDHCSIKRAVVSQGNNQCPPPWERSLFLWEQPCLVKMPSALWLGVTQLPHRPLPLLGVVLGLMGTCASLSPNTLRPGVWGLSLLCYGSCSGKRGACVYRVGNTGTGCRQETTRDSC